VGTTKEPPTTGKGAPPTTGKGAPPTTTTEEDDDDDEEIAEGVPPVDASTVANAEKVGASGADQSRVVVTGGEPWVGGGGQGGGKQAPVKQAPPEPLVEPAKPIPVKITRLRRRMRTSFPRLGWWSRRG
jgi:hypothetical protein